MKHILLALFLSSLGFCTNIIVPNTTFVADAGVTDLVYKEKKLYASTSRGALNVFDAQTRTITQRVIVPKIKDFMGDEIAPKIYSVDVLDAKIVLLTQGEKGYAEVFIYENEKLTKIIDTTAKLSIAKAKFIDEENLLLALLSNEIISYNLKSQKQNYKIQISQSKFSNFALSEDKTKVVTADESGELHVYGVKDGKLLQTLTGQNLDNVFAVDFKNNKIATAGQDRRVVVYDLKANTAYYKSSNFLIYSVGLSPSAKLCAYASDEQNNVTVFKTSSKSVVGVFGTNKMTLSKILFIDENEFFVASDDNTINFYQIK